jgi:hypothetical protein
MRFFLDNCLSPKLAQALDVLSDEHEVVHLSDKFPRDVTDVVWIEALGQEGDWVVMTGDLRILRSAVEREAWKASGLRVFFLKKAFSSLSGMDTAIAVMRRWEEITAAAASMQPGDGCRVPIRGRLERIH